MNRRTMLITTGAATAGLVLGACGPSKEKAVRVAGFVIDLSKESLPLLGLLGASSIADTVSSKVIPALEKLKDALSNANIPESRTTLETVRGALSAVANALLNLPESARRTTIIGILASINVLLLTVEAFVESEMSSTAKANISTENLKAPAISVKMRAVFEVTRQ